MAILLAIILVGQAFNFFSSPLGVILLWQATIQ
jgi:hypothetical protein